MPRVITPSMIADFRNRLCDAAADLLLEQGVEGFNMRELAKRLHVSPMTAYRYFKDKDEILAQLRARGFAALAQMMADAAERSPGDAAAVVRAYVCFALDQPITYRLMFDLFQQTGQEAPELVRHQRRVRALLNETAAGSAGDAPCDDDVLWSALHGLVALHLAGKLELAAFRRALSNAMRTLADTPIEFCLDAPAWLTAAE
jgi:AcrR family transcriptional regulator